MNDPPRLLRSGADDFERALLASNRSELPPSTALPRAMKAFAPGAAAIAIGTSVSSAAASSSGALVITKWAAGVALALACGAAAVRHVQSSPPIISAKVQSEAPIAKVIATTPSAPEAAATIAPVTATAASPAAVVPAPTVTVMRTAAPKRADDSLPEQVAAIDQARRAIASHDPGTALRVLTQYSQRFPHGTLAPEASALRIEALVQSGRFDQAKSLGARYLAAHPHSPESVRVEALLSPLR